MVYLLKMVIFHGYVSLAEGIRIFKATNSSDSPAILKKKQFS